jgi:hypothetical protein
VKVPIQATTGFNRGNHRDAGVAVNIEPLIPVRLTAQWDLLVRPSLTVGYLPTPSSQFGLSDLQTSFFLTPESANEWIWGIGPILQAPTASSTDLGSGKWAAGPTGGFAFNHGPWFNGILADQLMSFAGAHHRGSINQTYLEPLLSYSLDSGWSGKSTRPSLTTGPWRSEARGRFPSAPTSARSSSSEDSKWASRPERTSSLSIHRADPAG